MANVLTLAQEIDLKLGDCVLYDLAEKNDGMECDHKDDETTTYDLPGSSHVRDLVTSLAIDMYKAIWTHCNNPVQSIPSVYTVNEAMRENVTKTYGPAIYNLQIIIGKWEAAQADIRQLDKSLVETTTIYVQAYNAVLHAIRMPSANEEEIPSWNRISNRLFQKCAFHKPSTFKESVMKVWAAHTDLSVQHHVRESCVASLHSGLTEYYEVLMTVVFCFLDAGFWEKVELFNILCSAGDTSLASVRSDLKTWLEKCWPDKTLRFWYLIVTLPLMEYIYSAQYKYWNVQTTIVFTEDMDLSPPLCFAQDVMSGLVVEDKEDEIHLCYTQYYSIFHTTVAQMRIKLGHSKETILHLRAQNKVDGDFMTLWKNSLGVSLRSYKRVSDEVTKQIEAFIDAALLHITTESKAQSQVRILAGRPSISLHVAYLSTFIAPSRKGIAEAYENQDDVVMPDAEFVNISAGSRSHMEWTPATEEYIRALHTRKAYQLVSRMRYLSDVMQQACWSGSDEALEKTLCDMRTCIRVKRSVEPFPVIFSEKVAVMADLHRLLICNTELRTESVYGTLHSTWGDCLLDLTDPLPVLAGATGKSMMIPLRTQNKSYLGASLVSSYAVQEYGKPVCSPRAKLDNRKYAVAYVGLAKNQLPPSVLWCAPDVFVYGDSLWKPISTAPVNGTEIVAAAVPWNTARQLSKYVPELQTVTVDRKMAQVHTEL